MTDLIELADYRRQVAAHYAAVRAAADPQLAWEIWRRSRDELFISHPQSPLEPDARSTGYVTPFAVYDPEYRVIGTVLPTDGDDLPIPHSGEGTTSFRPFGIVEISLPTGNIQLTLFWLIGYGGGIFLPFHDATAGHTTYGGGRYLLDTVKGADLGATNGKVVLDFNYAYHPSCVYSSRWSCPLAPPQNRVAIPIPVGERLRD